MALKKITLTNPLKSKLAYVFKQLTGCTSVTQIKSDTKALEVFIAHCFNTRTDENFGHVVIRESSHSPFGYRIMGWYLSEKDYKAGTGFFSLQRGIADHHMKARAVYQSRKKTNMNTSTQSEIVTHVFFFLDGHKADIVESLFHSATEGYREEWCARSPFNFWCHLDLSNRERLIQLATEYYLSGSDNK